MPFSQESLDFLIQNRLQDSREWFGEHRDEYKRLIFGPMAELVTSLSTDMLKIDPDFITEPKVDRTISRIYRDVRFSKDKSLYRDNAWFVFMREKKLYLGLPAFYFEISPSGFGFGMGYYAASTASMTSIRKLILDRDPAFLDALEAFLAQDVFGVFGEDYKRSKYPDQPEEIRRWLDKKGGISFNHNSVDMDLLFSDNLAAELLRGYRLIAPVYNFLCRAEMRKI